MRIVGKNVSRGLIRGTLDYIIGSSGNINPDIRLFSYPVKYRCKIPKKIS